MSEEPNVEPVAIEGVLPREPRIFTADEQRLTIAYIQFLKQKVSSKQATGEQMETLEIAVQCLEGVFDISDKEYAFQPARQLMEVFKESQKDAPDAKLLPTASEEDIAKANKLKEEGNDLMKASQFDAAVAKYNDAIKLHSDPVYFCNRAAAYCRLENYPSAIQDCRTALAHDPSYSKAWGRMGLAFSCQGNYLDAANSYRKALELEPNQESYKNNLKIAEDKIRDMSAQRVNALQANLNPIMNMFTSLDPPREGESGMGSLAGLMQNPEMLNYAQEMMNDPQIQTMMNSLMTGSAGLADLMAAGQQMASRLQQSNPDLIDNLRRQFQPDGGAPPPPPPPAV